MNTRRPTVVAVALASLMLPLAACSGAADAGGAADVADGDGAPEVLAAFYPLEFVAEQVGGEHVEVSPITPAGVDPHDLELSTATVASLDGATVVYLSGFQAALDDALEVAAPERALDVAEPARVTSHEAEADGHEHEADGHGSTDEGPTDPHFWLDPLRLADVGDAVAAELSDADPGHADDYAANAEQLRGELEALDAEFAAGLERCETRTIVAAHEAYGYLTERYDLEQVGISGLDPESEPSPARLADIREVVESSGVTTIFTETLVNPAVAESLAGDLGIDVAVLYPLETAPEEGTYLDAMRQNLDTLTTALQCT